MKLRRSISSSPGDCMRASLMLIAIMLFAATLATAGAAPARSNRLPHVWLNRSLLAEPSRSPAVARALAATDGPYAIIQLRGPIAPIDRAALEQTGLALLEYLPDFAYLVRGSPQQIASATRLPQVAGSAALTLADKLDPALLRSLARGDTLAGQVRVLGWPNDAGALDRDLRGAALSAAAV